MKKILALILACQVSPAVAVVYEGHTQQEFESLEKTTVIRSEDSVTGYFVTFRYKNTDATRVRIYGE